MTKCEYGEYCLCGTCRYRTIESEKRNCCCQCVDCLRENRQVHDISACRKYERMKELMADSSKQTVQDCIFEINRIKDVIDTLQKHNDGRIGKIVPQDIDEMIHLYYNYIDVLSAKEVK